LGKSRRTEAPYRKVEAACQAAAIAIFRQIENALAKRRAHNASKNNYTMGIKAEMWQKMSNRKIPQSPGGLRYVKDIFYFLADVRRFLCTFLPYSPLTGITDRKGVVSPSSNFNEGIIKGDF